MPATFPTTVRNNPALAGQPATRKQPVKGDWRFAIAPVHTRFDAVEWFVWDAEQPDPLTGLPRVIRQCATFEEAVEGF